MPRFDDVTVAMTTALETCLATALAARFAPPAETCTVFGEAFQLMLSAGLTEDRCCSGFAAVRLAGLTPTDPQPGVFTPCGLHTWRADFEMGVARCAPWGTQDHGPTCAEMRTTAEQVQSDMAAMIEAQCCFQSVVNTDIQPDTRMSFTGWVPFGPEGRCTGGIMGLSVQIDACQCGGA